MIPNQFDNEYYIMSVDGKNNHPLLAWGSTSNAPFRKKSPIEEGQLELPLKIVFRDHNPKKDEMVDLLMLGAQWATSEKFKNLFKRENIYVAQFFPIEIECKSGESIKGYYAMHLWNRTPAIDKNNYKGGEPDMLGLIMDLKRFSLDEKLLNDTPLEKRKVIRLSEDPTMILVHQTIYEAIQAAGLSGMCFWKVSEWDEDAMFR